MTRRIRVSLVAIAVILALVGLGAARVPSLTVDQIQRMIDKTIAERVPGMIDTAIEGVTVETTIIEQTAGVTIEDVNAAIDAKVPGMLESALDERLGGEDLNPAIPLPIITNPVAGAINVRDYGAKGDGVTDDTSAINAAITAANAAGGGTVYVPDGIYKVPVDGYSNIVVLSNVKLQLADNAVIKGHYDSNYAWNHAVVRVRDRSNVEICGGTIKGIKQEYDVANEVGHGLAIQGSSNVYVHDINVCWNNGDGIFIGTSSAQLYSGNVRIERFVTEYNNRQGITIESGRNITIRDGHCRYQYLSYPMSGIDIEPVNNSWYVDNVLIDNVMCYGNGVDYPHSSYCYGIEVGFGWWYLNGGNTNGTPVSLKISNCRLFQNGNSRGYQINTDNIAVHLTSPALNVDYITLENNTYV